MDAKELLVLAKQRIYEKSLVDAEENNILYVLNREFDETHTHSRIIFYLLDTPSKKDRSDSFLVAFLRQIKIPETFIADESWKVYRERSFDDGRIDMVLESSEFAVVIEMKIGAEDGPNQLERYDSFYKSRRKQYRLYYLTLDGREPTSQSLGKMDISNLTCISFEKDIIEWLSVCLEYTEYGGYRYSFIKQYIGAVKHITGKGVEYKMGNLISDSESAFAVISLHEELQNIIADVMVHFLMGLMEYIESNSKYKCSPYCEDIESEVQAYYFERKKAYPGFYIVLESLNSGEELYRYYLYVGVAYESLYYGFEFDIVKDNKEKWADIDMIREKEVVFCDKCIRETEALQLRDIKKENDLYWAYLKNSKGEKLDFRNWSSGVIELIDDMDIQIEYIGNYIVYNILDRW